MSISRIIQRQLGRIALNCNDLDRSFDAVYIRLGMGVEGKCYHIS